MTDEIQLSVVVIICNRAEYIRACLDSALAVACSKEIICVDDASTDGTLPILQAYAAQHPEIRLICHERNEGTNITRYDGLALCRGRYMTYLDADDELIPDAMTELVRQAAETDADVLEFGTEVIPCGECTLERAQLLQRSFCPPARKLQGEDFCRLCFVDEAINTAQCGKLYARRLYRQAFGAMERVRMGNLYPQAWYLSWSMYFFVRTWRTVETVGFRYFAGRGQTQRSHEGLSHIRGNCDVASAVSSMRRTAEAAGRLQTQQEVLDKFVSTCCLQSVVTWMQRLAPEELAEGWRLLTEAWSLSDVIHVLIVRYGHEPERLRERLAAVCWEDNGLPHTACIVPAGLDAQKMQSLWQRACECDDSPLLLTDASADVTCLEALGAAVTCRLPEGEHRLLQRSWLLRMHLAGGNVGKVMLCKGASAVGDALVSRAMGCLVQLEKCRKSAEFFRGNG